MPHVRAVGRQEGRKAGRGAHEVATGQLLGALEVADGSADVARARPDRQGRAVP